MSSFLILLEAMRTIQQNFVATYGIPGDVSVALLDNREEAAMTEIQWLGSARPDRMFHYLTYERHEGGPTAGDHLREHPLISDRQARMFGCACVLLSRAHQKTVLADVDGYERDGFSVEDSTPHRAGQSGMDLGWAKGWCSPSGGSAYGDDRLAWGTLSAQRRCHLLRAIVGNPFRPLPYEVHHHASAGPVLFRRLSGPFAGASGVGADGVWLQELPWLTPTVVAVARGVYKDRDWQALPVLADALEDAGCTDADILEHLRGGPDRPPEFSWVRGERVLDLLCGY